MSSSLWIIMGVLAAIAIQVPHLLRSYRRGMKENAARLAKSARYVAPAPYAGIDIPPLKQTNENDPGRAVFHCLVRAVLVWGLDKNSYVQGPDIMDDGRIMFYSHYSAYQHAYGYLADVGLLEEGPNGYFLTCSYNDLGDATDAMYDRGIDLEVALAEMIGIIWDKAAHINILQDATISLRHFESRTTPIPDREIAELHIFENALARTNYLDAIEGSENDTFRLTDKGVNLLRNALLYFPQSDRGPVD